MLLHWGVSTLQVSSSQNLNVFFFLFRYFIFTSFWAYKIYYVYGFMMLVLVILCIVTVCVTIVCTYFLLNAEDYRWWVYWELTIMYWEVSLFKVEETEQFLFFFSGNGQASSLLPPLLFTFTCTPFTTISSKLSKFSRLKHLYMSNTSNVGLCSCQTRNVPHGWCWCVPGCTDCSRHPSTSATWLCSALPSESCVVSPKPFGKKPQTFHVQKQHIIVQIPENTSTASIVGLETKRKPNTFVVLQNTQRLDRREFTLVLVNVRQNRKDLSGLILMLARSNWPKDTRRVR